MEPLKAIANELADEWLSRMSAGPWQAHAESIQLRYPRACGETTSIKTTLGLIDVSDSFAWVDSIGGDILLTIEVYSPFGDDVVSSRQMTIRRPF